MGHNLLTYKIRDKTKIDIHIDTTSIEGLKLKQTKFSVHQREPNIR
jgi:hypothetical protein